MTRSRPSAANLTMRENTERPITCEMGTNVLVGTEPGRIVDEANRILDRLKPAPPVIPEKWDGRAAERIVEVLVATSFAPPR